MLDDKTLEWLGKSSACRFCHPGEECTGKPVSAESMGWEGYAYPHSECVNCRYFPQTEGDFRDAAEFEARVSEKLATVICAGCEDFNKKNVCPLAIYQASGIYECRMKHARLAVEREMIAEGKGPGRREEQ